MLKLYGALGGLMLAIGICNGIWDFRVMPPFSGLLIAPGAAFLGMLLGDIADSLRRPY